MAEAEAPLVKPTPRYLAGGDVRTPFLTQPKPKKCYFFCAMLGVTNLIKKFWESSLECSPVYKSPFFSKKTSVFSGCFHGMFPRSLKQVQETKAAWKAFESPQMPRDVKRDMMKFDDC